MKSIRITLFAVCLLSLYSCDSGDQPVAQREEATAGHHEEESSIVSLTPDQVRLAGIEMGALTLKNLESSIKVNGKLEVPAQNKASVTCLYEGVLQQILVHPGSVVRKGQVIATVTNTELAGVQQQLISVNAQVNLARLEYDRQKELVDGNAAPLKNLQKATAELSSLQAQQSALSKQLSTLGISPSSVTSGNISATLTLIAPISGTISDIHAQIGSRVGPGTSIAEIVNNSQLHLDLFVYEKDLPRIKHGQTIHFTLTNSPGKEYDATIFSIGTAFADASQSVPVHAEVEGEKSGLIEGMNVTAIISIGNRMATAIPTDAIVAYGGKDYIFIKTGKRPEAHEPPAPGQDHGNGNEHDHEHEGDHSYQEPSVNFERVQVVKGVSDLGFTEIQPVSELPEGVEIIVKGAFFVMAKMTNSGDHAH